MGFFFLRRVVCVASGRCHIKSGDNKFTDNVHRQGFNKPQQHEQWPLSSPRTCRNVVDNKIDDAVCCADPDIQHPRQHLKETIE